MFDSTATTEGQTAETGNGETPQTGATGTEQRSTGASDDQASTGAAPPWGDNFDPERAWNTIQNLRQFEEKAKQLEKALNETQLRLKEYEDREKTETQKLEERAAAEKERADKAEAELRRYRAQAALTESGANPKSARLLVQELSPEALDDKDRLAAEVARLKSDYPELFQSPRGSADGAAGTSAPKSEDMNSLIRAAVGRT